MSHKDNGWAIVKVKPEQVALMFLKNETEHLLSWHLPAVKTSDLIIRIVSTTGLAFYDKHVDDEGYHIYVFGMGSERLELKQGWSVLHFFQKNHVNVTGAVSYGAGQNIELFHTYEKGNSNKEFFYKSVYTGDEYDMHALSENKDVMLIREGLTQKVLYTLLSENDKPDMVLGWIINI